jgi:hypothetical protein
VSSLPKLTAAVAAAVTADEIDIQTVASLAASLIGNEDDDIDDDNDDDDDEDDGDGDGAAAAAERVLSRVVRGLLTTHTAAAAAAAASAAAAAGVENDVNGGVAAADAAKASLLAVVLQWAEGGQSALRVFYSSCDAHLCSLLMLFFM